MAHSSMKRRRFIKTTATGIATAYLSPTWIIDHGTLSASEMKSRVAIMTRSEFIESNEQINRKIVRNAVDEILIALTNKQSIRDAWHHIFPDLRSTDVIGLKVNCINKKLPSHPEVGHAIAESLVKSMNINPNNIIIWDRSDSELKESGYTVNHSGNDVRCFGTIPKFGMLNWIFKSIPDSEIGYDQSFTVTLGNEKQFRLTNILTKMCDYLINVPVLKDTSSAGVSLSMKNHFGSIDLPRNCHDDVIGRHIAYLNNLPQIKDKTKLIICDALFGIYSTGPFGAPQWINHQLYASMDTVAADYTGMTIIDQKRTENDEDLLVGTLEQIQLAVKLGLGTDDPRKIEKLDV